MKYKIRLFYIATFLSGCSNSSNKYGEQLIADTAKPVLVKEVTVNAEADTFQKPIVVSDTISSMPEDTMSLHFDLPFTEITESDFKKYEHTYKRNCTLDSSGFISGYGITLSTRCKDICESYLTETATGNKMLLPSTYDGGIAGLAFSPSCKQFITYASYDGPEYYKYYDERAELFGFTIGNGKNLQAIKGSFNFYSKEWSVTDVVWIDDVSIALKVYEGDRGGDGSDVKYKYLKTVLKQGIPGK